MSGAYTLMTNTFSHIPVDWVILAALVIIFAVDSFRAGSGRVNALAISLPIALLLVSLLPTARVASSFATQLSASAVQSVIFFVLASAAYFIARRLASHYGNNSGTFAVSVISAVAVTIIVVVCWIQVPQLQAVWQFGAGVQAVFSEAYRFWWMLGSFLVLAVLNR